ncbi:hypothetical protein GCM10027290_38170 [Micromonospora sonneratiae]|uniref:Uncharacterized protein n=1 Tax=Micromonospora sonneratiae TaxID=1184706 RepID=A0ABW3Y911_9ACTN
MADIHELMVSMDLPDDLSDAEVAEIRWHLGLGPQPEQLTIITRFPTLVFDDDTGEPKLDDDGGWLVVDRPQPVWGQSPSVAWKTGGVLLSTLLREDDAHGGSTLLREDDAHGGRWALTCRWEIHPDSHGNVARLFNWLARRCHGRGRFFGYLRWHEDDEPTEILTVRDGVIVTHRNGKFVAPLWDEPAEG